MNRTGELTPGRALREFIKNRPERPKTLYQQIDDKRSRLAAPEVDDYPLLENNESYKTFKNAEAHVIDAVKSYRKAIGELINAVEDWKWNDAVSSMYREVITDVVVLDPDVSAMAIEKDWARRVELRIPPGYKDTSKPDGGIGDYLIWMTILEIARTRKEDVIFVSGEQKSDWWHRSNSRQLYPRAELVEEFRRASDGATFHILSFADCLDSVGASASLVQEMRREQVGLRYDNAVPGTFAIAAYTALQQFLTNRYGTMKEGALPHFVTPSGRTGYHLVAARTPSELELKLIGWSTICSAVVLMCRSSSS